MQFRTRYYDSHLGRFLNRSPWFAFGGRVDFRSYLPYLHARWDGRWRKSSERHLREAEGSYIQRRYNLYDFEFVNPTRYVEPFSFGAAEGDEDGDGDEQAENTADALINFGSSIWDFFHPEEDPNAPPKGPGGEDLDVPRCPPPRTTSGPEKPGEDIPGDVGVMPPGSGPELPPLTVTIRFNNGLRDLRGRFASGNTPPGEDAVEDFCAMLKELGYEVVGREITIPTTNGDYRADVVVKDPEGNGFMGCEIKSGDAWTQSTQREKIEEIMHALAQGGTVPTSGENARENGIPNISSFHIIPWSTPGSNAVMTNGSR